MIEFLVLFLGLVSGPQTVAVATESAVAAVELVLDGRSVGTLAAAPWALEVDFGPELRPHILVAIARDSSGKEIDRATQRVNLLRPPAEISLLVERGEGGRPTAIQMNWESRTEATPKAIRASLDGRALVFDDPRQIPLPPISGDRLHLLEVEVEFADRVTATRQLALGGDFLDSASTELTALPVTIEAGPDFEGVAPDAAAMQGWFTRDGEPLRVVAVENDSTEMIFVRGQWAADALGRISGLPGSSAAGRLSGARAAIGQRFFTAAPLADGEQLRIVYPVAAQVAGSRMANERFPVTQPMDSESGGVFWLLRLSPPLADVEPSQRIADAVAVAGNQAAGSNRRRQVVVLLSSGSRDPDSRYSPAAVRSYLESLGVPLQVWYLGKAKKAPAAWGPAVGISSLAALERAVVNLRESLGSQYIVWLEGSHLPRDVQLSAAAGAVRLAGGGG